MNPVPRQKSSKGFQCVAIEVVQTPPAFGPRRDMRRLPKHAAVPQLPLYRQFGRASATVDVDVAVAVVVVPGSRRRKID
jgi:hypothetical protein